jgi:hypothetical protein
MKFLNTTALGLALALGAMTMAGGSPAMAKKAEAPAAAKQNFSEGFRKTAPAVQDAIAKGDIAAAQAALPAAQAAATTDDDKYTVAILQLQLALKTNDTNAQKAAADAVIASGKAPPETLAQVLDMKGRLAYNAGDLAGADAAFTQLSTLRPNDDDTAALLAQVKVREGRGSDALAIIDKSIDAKKAANQPVPEDWYRRALSIAYDSKPPIAAGVVKYGQGLVSAYPTPANWRTAIQLYREVAKPDPQTDLDAMRLARAAHALAGERDYYDYANSAYNKGLPGEAQSVIEEGTSSSMVDNQALKSSKALGELKAVAGPKVAGDKASLPALDKSARAAADGKKALNTADGYYGYGQYAQAADLYKVALSKGGVDANLVNLRLGMSLARAGDKAGAAQAFGAVTGPRQQLAGYWLIWANQQGGAAR